MDRGSHGRRCKRCEAIGGKPQLVQGIQIGDVLGDRAVIWSRADRPARLVVDYDVSSRFDDGELEGYRRSVGFQSEGSTRARTPVVLSEPRLV
jgi:phosphodiesterase/alkaline phosphatase D-like protein